MREQLTRKDVEKIEQEIEHRKLVVRKEAIEAVKEARAQGDLSENFEYYAAKKHKNQNESRIRYLERMLKTASIVSDDSRSDEVGMDDIVEVFLKKTMKSKSTSWSLPSVEIPWRTVSALNPLLEKHFGDIVSVTGLR